MSSPKQTKKCGGEGGGKEKKLEYLSFKYRKVQVTRKKSKEMKMVLTVCSELVLLALLYAS